MMNGINERLNLRGSHGKAWANLVAPASLMLSGVAAAATDASLVSRGQYIARAADCISCHTEQGGASFAGGRPLQTAFGSIFGANITPDKATGIGSWTKADFERALREGIRKSGEYLYPAMPYTSYAQMSPDDLDALWAYLQSLKPVAHQVRNPTLVFPLSIRSGLAVWQSLYFHPQRFTDHNDKPAQWNRGHYLVTVLGHCGECHTPRSLSQATEPGRVLTGASVEGWYAPNISGDSLSTLSDWSTTEIVRYLKTGRAPRNGLVVGPMRSVVRDSLQYLSAEDLQAIADYLKNANEAAQPRAVSSASLPADSIANGRTLYDDHCGSCHQPNGKGVTGVVPALAANDLVSAAQPFNVIMAILEGLPAQGIWGAMSGFANTLNDDQIADLTNYIRVSWNNAASPNATPQSVARLRANAHATAGVDNARLCPTLPASVLAPAMARSDSELTAAARDASKLSALVNDYQSARPRGSTAQLVEALSTAYCRVLAKQPMSSASMGARLADFSQRVALSATSRHAGT